MPQTLADIDLRSEEVQEILNAPPSWLIRWGIAVLLSLILLLLVISNLVKYPDVIPGAVVLTTQNPPIKIVANSSGRLSKLFLQEGELVASGDIIAEIENPVTTQGVEYMKRLMSQLKVFLSNPNVPIQFLDSGYVFGNMQTEYNELKKSCIDYHQWITDAYRKEQVQSLELKIRQYDQLIDITKRQTRFSIQELANTEEKYKSDQMLFKEGVLAKLQFFQEESAYRQHQQEVENFRKSATQNQITLSDLEKQLLDIKHDQLETERNFREGIIMNIHAILNQIDNWQKSYLITAPVGGKLSYLEPLNKNQFVGANDFLFAVVPKNDAYLGIMDIPTKGFGKVKTGQAVQIKLDNYPYQEYGQVNGTVKRISQLANADTYRAEIKLPKGLTTSYNKQLGFTPEMKGTAEIITEDLSVMDRIFYSFRKIFKQ